MLRRLRKTKGLTQGQLARKVGVTQPYIAMLERGAKKNPSLTILKRIARALGVPVTALLK